METENTSPTDPEKCSSFLVQLLTGWGIPGSLARIIAGALLGALSAICVLSQSGCLAEWTQSGADGGSWHGRLEFSQAKEASLISK